MLLHLELVTERIEEELVFLMQFVFFSGCRCKRRYLRVSCESTENRYTT